MMKDTIVDCDNVMQCEFMPVRHLQGPVSEWPQNFHNILDHGTFILCSEDWPAFTGFWILERLAGEFPESGASLKQLQCRIPKCLHIHNRYYRAADYSCLTVTELVSTTKHQHNQYSKDPLLYEG